MCDIGFLIESYLHCQSVISHLPFPVFSYVGLIIEMKFKYKFDLCIHSCNLIAMTNYHIIIHAEFSCEIILVGRG